VNSLAKGWCPVGPTCDRIVTGIQIGDAQAIEASKKPIKRLWLQPVYSIELRICVVSDYESYFNLCIKNLPKNKPSFSAVIQSFEQNVKHLSAYSARKITATLQQLSLTEGNTTK
jgi:hypothetical protein